MALVLERQKRTRRRPVVGDIVAMRIEGVGWVAGRVVSLEAHASAFDAWSDAILFYVFRRVSPEPMTAPFLPVREFLIPPLMTGYELWQQGYVRLLENRPLLEGERLKQHCFASLINPGTYYDERGHELDRRYEPCGSHGLTTLVGVDDAIRTALGLPSDL